MKNQKFAKGTIGAAVQRLVKRYGHYPAGITILEMALEKAVGSTGTKHTIQTGQYSSEQVYLTHTPGYEKAILEERKSYGRMGIVWYNEEAAVAKKYTPQGRVVAVRFALGTTEQEMRDSMEKSAGKADFRPYDESTNTFI